MINFHATGMVSAAVLALINDDNFTGGRVYGRIGDYWMLDPRPLSDSDNDPANDFAGKNIDGVNHGFVFADELPNANNVEGGDLYPAENFDPKYWRAHVDDRVWVLIPAENSNKYL